MDEDKILTNLISGKELKTMQRMKRTQFDYITVRKGKESEYDADGWEIHKRNKKSTRLKKKKPVGKALEDEIWTIFAKMGFDEMNMDNQFKIPLDYKNGLIPPKQIDIFAKDDEAVILVECKAAEEPKQRSFQKDINEIQGIREKIIAAVRAHYGRESKLKIGWIFATRNIIWAKPDIDRANEANILIMNEQNIDYYDKLVHHIGKAAKYQLMAEIFSNQKIPNLDITIPAIKGKTGDLDFYTFNIEPEKLLKIAFISHRNKMDKETYISYQRMLKKGRLDSIREYIDNGGVFPTSVVVNIFSGKQGLDFQPITHKKDALGILGHLKLPSKYKSVWVIDGQHRLYGFSKATNFNKTTIPVIAFENLQSEIQAKMFVDINSKQVRVPPNHLTDLYSDLFWESSNIEMNLYALISRVVRNLSTNLQSPLKDRIAPVSGRQKSNTNQPITIKSLYDAIYKPELIGKVAKGDNTLLAGPLYIINNEETLERATKIISSYLGLFKSQLPEHWELGSQPGGLLCTNGGVTALLIALKHVFDHIENKCGKHCENMTDDEIIAEIGSFAQPIIDWFATATQEDIFRYRLQFRGSAGHTNIAYSMMSQINQKKNDFNPQGLQDYIKRSSTVGNEEARKVTYELQKIISEHVLSKLKEKYGLENEKWWYEGIPETIRTEIVARRERDHAHSDKESYFMLVDYKEIILKNWDIFSDIYKLDASSSKRDFTAWFIKLNDIRNKVSHPERGLATSEELEFIRKIKERIKISIQKSNSTESELSAKKE